MLGECERDKEEVEVRLRRAVDKLSRYLRQSFARVTDDQQRPLDGVVLAGTTHRRDQSVAIGDEDYVLSS